MADKENRMSPAETGNASNPSPHDSHLEPERQNSLLGEKAETYLRESGNIEDMPDPREAEEPGETSGR